LLAGKDRLPSPKNPTPEVTFGPQAAKLSEPPSAFSATRTLKITIAKSAVHHNIELTETEGVSAANL